MVLCLLLNDTSHCLIRAGKGDGWLRGITGEGGGGGGDGGVIDGGEGLTMKGMSASRQQAVLQQFKVMRCTAMVWIAE